MEYHKTITLKDGRACTLRNGTAEDGQALLNIFNVTHAQTDFLLTYPEEHSYTAEDEAELLRRKTDSADEIELLAFVDGAIVGSAGVRRDRWLGRCFLCRSKGKDPSSCGVWHQCG